MRFKERIVFFLGNLSIKNKSSEFLHQHFSRVMRLLLISGMLHAFFNYAIGIPEMLFVNITFLLFCVWLIKTDFAVKIKFGLLHLACYISVLILMLWSGGISSPLLPLMILVFMGSIFFNHTKVSLMMVAVPVTLIGYFVMDLYNLNFENKVPLSYQETFENVYYVFEFILLIVLILIYQYEASIFQRKLRISNEQQNATFNKLVKSEKFASLGLITAGIAHEINNPVNFMQSGTVSMSKNIADLLTLEKRRDGQVSKIRDLVSKENCAYADKVLDGLKELDTFKKDIEYELVMDELRVAVDSIQVGIRRTTEIVKGIKTYTREDLSDYSNTNIHHYIDSTLILVKNELRHEIIIVRDYGEIPTIECNYGKISQVFLNLLSNAIQAINGPGEVVISTKYLAEKESVLISIKDSGAGIDQTIIDRVFEPFYTTKSPENGTGLGLSISKSIVENHDGQLYFETGELGTVFHVELPVHQKIQSKPKKESTNLMLSALAF